MATSSYRPCTIYRFVFTEQGLLPLTAIHPARGGAAPYKKIVINREPKAKKLYFNQQVKVVLTGCGEDKEWIKAVNRAADHLYANLASNGLDELLMIEQTNSVQFRIAQMALEIIREKRNSNVV